MARSEGMELYQTPRMVMIMSKDTENERIAVLETKVKTAETAIGGIGTDVKEIRKDLHRINLNQSMLFGGLIVVDIVAKYFLR